MTNQEAFNIVWQRFIVEKAPFGYDKEKHHCLYRHPDDPSIRCAVGACLPDELYSPGMEKKPFTRLIQDYPDVAEFFSGCDIELLAEMQDAHDDYASTINYKFFKEELLVISERYRL